MHEKQKGFLELGGANFDPLKDTDTETSKDRYNEVDDSWNYVLIELIQI